MQFNLNGRCNAMQRWRILNGHTCVVNVLLWWWHFDLDPQTNGFFASVQMPADITEIDKDMESGNSNGTDVSTITQ